MRTPHLRLRAVTPADVDDVLALNQAEVEKLAPMDEPRLQQIQGWAHRFDVIEVEGAFGGFVVTFEPGAPYDSPYYTWFGERFGDRFYYLDRVVLHSSVRRQGVGGAVYDELEQVAQGYSRMALEVNLVPRNPPSLAFHDRRGYAEVGRLGDSEHLVSLMARDLT